MSENPVAASERVRLTPASIPGQPPAASDDLDLLTMALAKAQGMMISPARNKNVKVTTKQGGSYEFRYTTLDAMIDMARAALSENGLVVTNLTRYRNNSLVLFTILLHTSGQWLETQTPLVQETDGGKGLKSAVTYARRTAYELLLNIAGDEDDDHGAASGDHNEYRQRPSQKLQGKLEAPNAERQTVAHRYKALMAAVDETLGAKTPDAGAGVRILKAWQAEMVEFSACRDRPERAEAWEAIQTRIPAALERVWGPQVAEAWLMALGATTTATIATLRQNWAGPWLAAMDDLKRTSPTGAALLTEHIQFHAKRCAQAEAPPAEPHAEAEEEVTEPANDTQATTPQDSTTYQLYDAHGGFCQEFKDPKSWASAYVAAHMSIIDPDLRRALEEHNAESAALAAEHDRRAGEMLQELSAKEEPRPEMRIEPPRTSGGQIAIAPYLQLCQEAIGLLRTADAIRDWDTANRPVFSELPGAMQLKVQGYILRRIEAISGRAA